MCMGPSAAEKELAAQRRADAEAAKAEALKKIKDQKTSDINAALQESQGAKGAYGGRGRRSLFSTSGAGFLGRFG